MARPHTLFVGSSILLNLGLMSYVFIALQSASLGPVRSVMSPSSISWNNNPNPTSYRTETITTNMSEAITEPMTSKPTLRTLLNCTDTPRRTYIGQKGKYLVYYNYIPSSEYFHCHQSITLTTHGEAQYIAENLDTLVKQWEGPIAISVFTLKTDYLVALKTIQYLRKCQSPLIKKLVTFHFIFEERHFPKKIFTPDAIHSFEPANCSSALPKFEKSYRNSKKILYPVNVARNAARDTANTYFVMPSDIELYPNRNFISNFLSFIQENPKFVEKKPPALFVLPIFEVDKNSSVPQDKAALVDLINKQKAVVFHKHTCPQCQRVPGYTKWLKDKTPKKTEVTASSKRQGSFAWWEPIYVGTHLEPPYDERLSWEGKKDKMTQMFALCVMDYDFMVLNSAFLVHKPGIKKQVKEPWRNVYVNRQNKFVAQVVKPELLSLYGTRKNCSI